MSINKDLDEKEISYYARFPMALYEGNKAGIVPTGYIIDRDLSKLDTRAEIVYVNTDKRQVVWTLTGTRLKPILQTDGGMIVDLLRDAFLAIGGISVLAGDFAPKHQSGGSLADQLVLKFVTLYQKYYLNRRDPYHLIMSSHSLGASQQQLLMRELLDKRRQEKNGLTDYKLFIKSVYGFNLGLSPIDMLLGSFSNVIPEDREYWEEHNHLVIVKGDIISSRIADPETFDFVMPQHVQVLEPKLQFKNNPHTILNFFTDTDLREIEKIVSPTVIEISESMPPLPRSQEEQNKVLKDIQENKDKFIKKIDKLQQEKNVDKPKLYHEPIIIEGLNMSDQRKSPRSPSVQANPQMGTNRGYKSLTSISETRQISTRHGVEIPYAMLQAGRYNRDQTFYSISNDNRRASQNPQSGISPALGSMARAASAPPTLGQVMKSYARSPTGTTTGKIGGAVIGSTTRPDRPESSASTSMSDVNRYDVITGLGYIRGGKIYEASAREAKHEGPDEYKPIHTDPYRIQSLIEQNYKLEGHQRVKRAPQLKRERKFVVDPLTGRSVETYETTAVYGGEEQLGALATFPEEHMPRAVVHPLIGEKPKVTKGSGLSQKETPLPPARSGAVVRKSGLKPDKKYNL